MKQDVFPIVEISQLSEAIRHTGPFADELVLWEVENTNEIPDDEETPPIRLNGVLVFLITDGTLKISIDYIQYEAKAGSLVIIMPDHITQFKDRSKDLQAHILVVSKTFLESTGMSKTPPPMLQYMYVRKNPCTKIEPEDQEVLTDAYLHIRKKLTNRKHNYLRETVQNALMGFLLELGNIFRNRQEITPPLLTRKEELFEQFLRLLYEYGKEEHRVTFYADKLFITSQYLSSILKELSGKPANKWIEDTLILEAKLLLKAPQATVQQVADQLHFSDQSTFGKFFKKHVGMSPSEYRKS